MNKLLNRLNDWLFPTALLLIIATIPLMGDHISSLLSFQRTSIIDSEYWRLITANFIHLNDNHLYLNGAGLLLIWLLVGDKFKAIEWLFLTALLALTVSIGLFIFNPDLQHYVGLSGVLHGLLVAGALKYYDSYEEMVLLALVVVKLLYEQAYGPLSGSEELINGSVIVDAHLYGAIVAMGYMYIRRVFVK